jgi:hypothetical protein
MMKRLFFVLVVSLLFVLPANAATINFNQLQAMLVTCMKLIQTEDFEGAAMMYHYPPNYTEEELDTDIKAVTESLRIFSEEFGKFGPIKSLEEPKLYVNIHASGGTHVYWDKQRQAMKIELETEFENYGPGFLIFQVVDIVGTLEIKAIAYGLPVSGESVARIKKVGDRMMPLMQNSPDERTFPEAPLLNEDKS